MKAIVCDRYGTPDDLRLENLPMPELGDDEVLVEVRAVSINSWDWDTLTGKPLEYRLMSGIFKPKSNCIHGCDIAGIVAQVGRSVQRYRVGDEVFGDLAEGGWGAFAEYARAGETELTPKPASLTFEEAACISHGGNLAVQGLVDAGRIRSGQKVLINGGGGSTGTLAIQIAKSFDADVTAIDQSDKLATMRALGADRVIDYTREDFTQGGRKYDLIFDVKTNRSAFRYLGALNENGAYVTVGGKTSRILQILLLGKFLKKFRMHMVVYQANKDSAQLVDLIQAGKLRPVIDRCFPLEQAADAFRYFGQGRFKGKVVVTLDKPEPSTPSRCAEQALDS